MIFDFFDSLTLGTTSSTLLDGRVITSDDIATTLTTTMTSATTNGGPVIEVHAASAREYVSSMNVEEIDDLLLKIDEKEMALSYAVENNSPKVKKIGSINGEKKI